MGGWKKDPAPQVYKAQMIDRLKATMGAQVKAR
jgi:hypothetical protein